MKSDDSNNVVKIDDYIKIPDGYESDIFVDLNNPIKWNKIKKILNITDYYESNKK